MPTQLIAAYQQVVPISTTGQIQANYKVGELIALANSYGKAVLQGSPLPASSQVAYSAE